jgi:D-glycero-alpha-D-manno-heptose 1-phosphate guanylyltransferase
VKIDAVILAGGMGTRLRGVVANRPKVLAKVGGRPFITRLLDQLAESGVERVVISTGYMAERVEAEIGADYRGLHIGYAPELEPLGTGGGARLALEKISSNPLFVLNGDSFCRANFEHLLEFHLEKRSRATLMLTMVPDTSRYGRIEADESGAVTGFEEKGGSHLPGWINAGVYCLEREILASLVPGQSVSIEREIFPALIGAGLFAFRGGGAFIDIGTPESFAEAERFFA